ncbi:MAG: hypothetical protein IT370_26920 [Deltaproteobacteria bacterium]|nr:hypothetical protein [Deltaproteobacteria bacterium]
MAPDDADAPDEIDFDDRELCSDDACIGVIGEDGKCNECGRAGKRPAGGARAVNTNATGASAADKAKAHLDKAFKADKGGKPDKQLSKPPKAGSGAGAAGGGDGDSDWDNRELCSDGSCIGVIGKNGKCNECGKAAG